MRNEELVEKLAALEHEQWAHWTEHMLDQLHVFVHLARGVPEALPALEHIARWREQISTPYEKLTEKEKESDREWARKALALMKNPGGTP